ncbi:MAG: HXXEE domain-containing protein [Treponema sp.]
MHAIHIICDGNFLFVIWLGAFIAYTVHLVVHIGQSIIIKKYIPALITSIICLPLSIWLIAISIHTLSYSISQVLIYSLIGLAAIAGNLKFAHWIIHTFTKKLKTPETD